MKAFMPLGIALEKGRIALKRLALDGTNLAAVGVLQIPEDDIEVRIENRNYQLVVL